MAVDANTMLRAVHAANANTTAQRYTPEQLQAAYAALQKPKAQAPTAAVPGMNGGATTPPASTPTDPNRALVAPGTPASPNPPSVLTPTGSGPFPPTTPPAATPPPVVAPPPGTSNYVPPAPTPVNNTLTGVNPTESGNTQSAIDAAFGQLTQNTDKEYARNKAELTQTLANKGIAYSNDPNSQYQQQMGDLDTRYDQIRADAKQKAVLTGYQEYQNLYGNQEKGNLDTSQIGYQGAQTASTYSGIDTSQRAQTESEQESQSRIKDTLVQEGLDSKKVDLAFQQLKITGNESDAQIQSIADQYGLDKEKMKLAWKTLAEQTKMDSRRFAPGPSGGGTAIQAPVSDPFGA